MLRYTPIKNSKNVDKPFRSPFDNINKLNVNATPTKLLKKSFEAKKTLLLDEDEKKQSCESTEKNLIPSSEENDPKVKGSVKRKCTDTSNVNEPSKKRKQEAGLSNKKNNVILGQSPKILPKTQITAIKRRIFEKKQELESLKSRQMCAQKHNPDQLKESIKKWKTACQEALGELCYELNQRNNDVNTLKISDVLQNLGIPKTLVGYSEEEDTFI